MASRKTVAGIVGRKRTKPRRAPFGVTEFYRTLDRLPERFRSYFVLMVVTGLPIEELCALRPENLDHEARAVRVRDARTEGGVRTIYVADHLWPWVRAAVPVPFTHWYLRDHWSGAVDRAELDEVSVSQLRRLRSKLLAQAKDRPVIRLVGDEAREEAKLLGEALQALALTDDEALRLLVRSVPG